MNTTISATSSPFVFQESGEAEPRTIVYAERLEVYLSVSEKIEFVYFGDGHVEVQNAVPKPRNECINGCCSAITSSAS